MVMVVVSMVMSFGASSLVTDYSFGFSLSSISETRQKGLQNNWLPEFKLQE